MFKDCHYIISAVTKEQFPNKKCLNEYVFVGRSNVGKSSLINFITNRKILAKTSSKPGKTQTINFFLIDEKLYFVDVPGYGYASKSIDNRIQFGDYIEEYLKDNPNLKKVFLLIDTKVGPTKDDIMMCEYLKYLHLNIIVVATKSDKIGKTLLPRAKKEIQTKLNINKIIITSTVSKIGIEELLQEID